jgi:large subunit ribosomal protein L30
MVNDDIKYFTVIRLRGKRGVRKKVEDTLKMLRLNRVNHASLVPGTSSFLGMLQFVKDYVTWGEVNEETTALLLKKRGFIVGNKKLSDQLVKEKLGYNSIDDLAKELNSSKIVLSRLPLLKPVFRLSPPSKGFKGSKHMPYPEGSLGYRGEAINDLLKRMI